MRNYYAVTDPDTLRQACVANRWFTCGTVEQYNRMFELNADAERWVVKDIALIIWICSDGVAIEDVCEELARLREERLDYIANAYEEGNYGNR